MFIEFFKDLFQMEFSIWWALFIHNVYFDTYWILSRFSVYRQFGKNPFGQRQFSHGWIYINLRINCERSGVKVPKTPERSEGSSFYMYMGKPFFRFRPIPTDPTVTLHANNKSITNSKGIIRASPIHSNYFEFIYCLNSICLHFYIAITEISSSLIWLNESMIRNYLFWILFGFYSKRKSSFLLQYFKSNSSLSGIIGYRISNNFYAIFKPKQTLNVKPKYNVQINAYCHNSGWITIWAQSNLIYYIQY